MKHGHIYVNASVILRQGLLAILLFFFSNTFAATISGKIYDAETNGPVEFATAYINGTSIGTISDENGSFSLEYDIYPCQLIIQHVSYESKMLEVSKEKSGGLVIRLSAKNFNLPPVEIESENLRIKNLRTFRRLFLGIDEWGMEARILNDSVLRFEVEYSEPAPDDTLNKVKLQHFKVYASAPLQIEQPSLGYLLEYDLVNFEIVTNPEMDRQVIRNRGYSYFKEEEIESKRKVRKINRNRVEAFYNSTLHFNRSLIEGNLKQNGYELLLVEPHETESGIYTSESYVSDISKHIESREYDVILFGLKGSRFAIDYTFSEHGPVNLFEAKDHVFTFSERSYMYITQDSCIIRKNGTLPGGGAIVFEGNIVDKRMGAALPSNFSFGKSKGKIIIN